MTLRDIVARVNEQEPIAMSVPFVPSFLLNFCFVLYLSAKFCVRDLSVDLWGGHSDQKINPSAGCCSSSRRSGRITTL